MRSTGASPTSGHACFRSSYNNSRGCPFISYAVWTKLDLSLKLTCVPHLRPWVLPCEHLDHRTTQGPHVCLVVVACSRGTLWRGYVRVRMSVCAHTVRVQKGEEGRRGRRGRAARDSTALMRMEGKD